MNINKMPIEKWAKGLKREFTQRNIHIKTVTYEKTLDFSSHQGNANLKHNTHRPKLLK